MPRRKKQAEATEKPAAESTTTTAAANGKAAGRRGLKYQALREALQELGKGAKNNDLADHIRSRYGAAAVPANISVAKSNILKRMRGRKGKARRASAPAKAKPAAQARPSPAVSFSLEDLRQVKELARRLGKDHLKQMVDLLA